jgi:hypothetical protein
MRLYAGDGVSAATAPSSTRRLRSTSGEVSGRGINNVDLDIFPFAGRGGGGDGDAALLLLLHPVHDSGAVMHLTDLMGAAGVIEDRSVVVVFPASIWAAMPMFLILSSAIVRAI